MAVYIENQPVLNTIVEKIISNNTVCNAYMLSCENNEILEMATKLLTKVCICNEKYDKSCNKCSICKRIEDGNCTELSIINPVNNVIKKEEIIKLKTDYQTFSIESKNKVYVINKCECLNASSANSILKFLEEPDSNIIGIFTTNNLANVLETIKSRCQIIKLNNVIDNKKYFLEYVGIEKRDIDLALEYIKLIDKDEDFLISEKYDDFLKLYETKDKISSFLRVSQMYYLDILNKITFNRFKYFDFLEYNITSTNQKKILEKIEIILSCMEELGYNVNVSLFMCNYVIRMGDLI